jgi:hypothetical protein
MRALIVFFRNLLATFTRPRSSRRRRRSHMLLFVLLLAAPLLAQSNEEPAIQDNSFLIEEAYNQDPGVVQHILTFAHATNGGDWVSTFTQEWPAPSLKHQLSFTAAAVKVGDASGFGDFDINYRYQLIGDADARLAVAPRISLLLPTGSERRGLGAGAAGVQVMLPVSFVLTPTLVAHTNLGATLTPANHEHSIVAGQSLVWLARPRINALVETLWTRDSDRSGHTSQFTISPGIRWSYNLPHHLQIVPGVAFPITHPHNERAVFFYLSFEHPFRGES